MHQIANVLQKPLIAVGEIARDLAHPLAIGSGKDPRNIDSASLKVDDEENAIPNQAESRDYLGAEEVGCRNRAPMGRQEGLPGHRTTPGWIDSVLGEHALDRVSADLVAEVHQGAPNARVSPSGSLESHPNDEALDLAIHSRTPGPSL